MPKSDFITELQAVVNRQDAHRPASMIVKNLDLAAAISKFTKPRETGRPSLMDPDAGISGTSTGVDQISKAIIAQIENNDNIFRLFPDIELAVQIIVSSILSPKDMIKSELIYRVNDANFPPGMVAEMIEIVRAEMRDNYHLQEDQPTIIRDALFRTGSYVKAILPESAVDQLINQRTGITTESMYSSDLFLAPTPDKPKDRLVHLGLLGDPTTEQTPMVRRLALEDALSVGRMPDYNAGLYTGTYKPKSDVIDVDKLIDTMKSSVEVADNYNFLKMPKLLEAANEQNVRRLTGSRLGASVRKLVAEQYHEFKPTTPPASAAPTPKELTGMLYKAGNTQYTPFLHVPGSMSLARRSVGRPLVLHIPSEAAIPVHVPGDCTTHIGYFVPTDIDGNPVTADTALNDNGQGLASMLQSDKTASASALLIDKARKNLAGDGIVPVIDHMTELYGDIIENDMLTRLSKGAYGKKLSISRNNEIYRIMLSRALQSQFTRLIYIPAEYVSYFAFNYHRNGVGKSYLDDLSNITSMRAMVVFSRVMSAVKSSIETTHVDVTIDPRDHDPQKTIEMAKHYVARSKQQYFPHGLSRIADLTDWIHRAGIEITFQGHPRLPTTKFDFESKNTQHVPPDDSLEELFRDQTYMHFGLTPEMMDGAGKTDFATTIQNNSILFSRRILVLSDKHSKDLTGCVRKICSNDEVVQEKLVKVISAHKSEIEARMSDDEKALYQSDATSFVAYLLEAFIESLEVDMPKPDFTRGENQKTEFKSYEEKVEAGLAYIFSADMLPQELAGEANQYVDALKAAWKAALMRAWMADNNYAPELFEITNRTEDGKPMVNLLDMTKTYTENVMLNIVSFIEAMKEAKAATNADLTNLNPGESSGGGSSSSGSDEFGGGSGETDEFGMPTGGDENSPFDNPTGTPNEPEGEEGSGTSTETPPESPENEEKTPA